MTRATPTKLMLVLMTTLIGVMMLYVTACARHIALPMAARAYAGLGQLHRLGPRIYSGGQPADDEGFASLARLGVRTIISVDGARPKVRSATAHGLRYVHIPVGYDGIDRAQALQLARAVQDSPGPVYVHCHRGLHRGPTAAVIAAMAVAGWSHDQALAAMRRIGTSPHYRGLYRSVQAFRVPSEAELASVSATFDRVAAPPPLAQSMASIDTHWVALLDARNQGWSTPEQHPDIDPAHEALQIRELFREIHRRAQLEGTAYGPAFSAHLQIAQEQASKLEQAIRQLRFDIADRAQHNLQRTCLDCHARFRD